MPSQMGTREVFRFLGYRITRWNIQNSILERLDVLCGKGNADHWGILGIFFNYSSKYGNWNYGLNSCI